jgi:D-alanyl-D-alanine carboxypeptidase/D-alanyl-D-alanine-endopeptidase (penicillin-binding protein 4)
VKPAAGTLAVLLAATPITASAPPVPDVAAGVERAVRRCGLKADRVSVAVVDARSGQLLASHLPDRERVPASCLKVATTAAALLALGQDHRMRTRLAAVPPSDGSSRAVIAGDLWLLGGGDPGLSEHGQEGNALLAVDAMASAALRRGIRTVRGDLVFDTSYFDGPRVHPSWTDAGASARWFAAEVDALNINDGCVDVTVNRPAREGDEFRVEVFPETSLVTLVPALMPTAKRKEHGFRFVLDIPENRLHLKGRIWTRTPGSSASASIHDPARLCAEQVGKALARAGIRIEGVVRARRADEEQPDRMAVLAEHVTTLERACAVSNTRSQNLWAETVLRVLGAEKGEGGSFKEGARLVRETLAGAGDAVASQLHPVDGSGLSRDNRASALALARSLALAWNSAVREPFFEGMAKPGAGTLEKRFREEHFAGRVFAKTGTLRGISGLCGLALGPGEAPLVFAVLGERVDVSKARALQDAVVGVLVGPGGGR